MSETKAWCAQCGPTDTDDDGCCDACGATATGDGADIAHEMLESICDVVDEIEAGAYHIADLLPRLVSICNRAHEPGER